MSGGYGPLRRNTYVEILVCLDSLRVPSAGFLPMTFGDGTGLDQKVTESEGIPPERQGIPSKTKGNLRNLPCMCNPYAEGKELHKRKGKGVP